MNFKELLGKQMLFFDGATGTQLQARGLQPGELPESWNFIHPDIVEAVHRSYLDVGSNIVKSNTFGANPLKLAGSGLDCKETIEAAVAIAKKACGGRENKFVALNLGPTGKLLAPYGSRSLRRNGTLRRCCRCGSDSYRNNERHLRNQGCGSGI